MHRDLIIGIVLLTISGGTLASLFGYAIHHDCTPKPALHSTFFGHSVPVERICSLFRY